MFNSLAQKGEKKNTLNNGKSLYESEKKEEWKDIFFVSERLGNFNFPCIGIFFVCYYYYYYFGGIILLLFIARRDPPGKRKDRRRRVVANRDDEGSRQKKKKKPFSGDFSDRLWKACWKILPTVFGWKSRLRGRRRHHTALRITIRARNYLISYLYGARNECNSETDKLASMGFRAPRNCKNLSFFFLRPFDPFIILSYVTIIIIAVPMVVTCILQRLTFTPQTQLQRNELVRNHGK